MAHLTEAGKSGAASGGGRADSLPESITDRRALAAKLPKELRSALHQAVAGGYLDRIASLIDEVESYDLRLGTALRSLAEIFAHQQLLEILSE